MSRRRQNENCGAGRVQRRVPFLRKSAPYSGAQHVTKSEKFRKRSQEINQTMGRKKRPAGGGVDTGYLVQPPVGVGGLIGQGVVSHPDGIAVVPTAAAVPGYSTAGILQPPDAKYPRLLDLPTSTPVTSSLGGGSSSGTTSKEESYSVKKYRPEKAYRSIEAFAKYTKIHRMLDATYVRFPHGGTAEKPYVFATRIAGSNLSWGRGKTRDAAIDAAVRAAFFLVQAHGYTDFPWYARAERTTSTTPASVRISTHGNHAPSPYRGNAATSSNDDVSSSWSTIRHSFRGAANFSWHNTST